MKTALTRLCIAAALTVSTCSSGGAAPADCSDSREITSVAVASLTEVFEDIADEFESAEPGAPTVKFSFAGSSDLVSQISEGAPADVIATADEETMDTLDGDDLLARQPSMFASNTLT